MHETFHDDEADYIREENELEENEEELAEKEKKAATESKAQADYDQHVLDKQLEAAKALVDYKFEQKKKIDDKRREQKENCILHCNDRTHPKWQSAYSIWSKSLPTVNDDNEITAILRKYKEMDQDPIDHRGLLRSKISNMIVCTDRDQKIDVVIQFVDYGTKRASREFLLSRSLDEMCLFHEKLRRNTELNELMRDDLYTAVELNSPEFIYGDPPFLRYFEQGYLGIMNLAQGKLRRYPERHRERIVLMLTTHGVESQEKTDATTIIALSLNTIAEEIKWKHQRDHIIQPKAPRTTKEELNYIYGMEQEVQNLKQVNGNDAICYHYGNDIRFIKPEDLLSMPSIFLGEVYDNICNPVDVYLREEKRKVA